ncbi:MAG: hypothetical protein IJE45_06195 [Bacilli bacterium]|nr:hypothetical protein [Bacilli bacterium]
MKNGFKILIIILLLNIVFNNYTIVYGNTNNVYVIYSDLELKKNDELRIVINVEDANYYNSCIINIDIKDDFSLVNSVPCELLLNSYFDEEEIYVNELTNNNIRFVAFKNKSNTTTTFNNLVQITLKANSNIKDVISYFDSINITLQDKSNNTIVPTINYSEGMKVEWDKESYIVELNEKLPDFLSDIVIYNREEDEYTIKLIVDDINTSVVSNKIVSVYIYDYVNSSQLYISKTISIVDNIRPIIKGNSVIEINDVDLTKDSIFNYTTSDNYDDVLTSYITYYNQEQKEVKDLDAFVKYLSSNTIGYLKIIVEDSSKNKSEELVQTIKIIDTTSPVVSYNKEIEIEDRLLDSFNILDYIKAVDQYDTNPLIVFNEDINLVEYLKEHISIELTFNSKDCFNNKTDDYIISISIIDTVIPTIDKLNDLSLKDVHFGSFEEYLSKCFKVVDNYPNYVINYKYMSTQEVNFEDFKKYLFSNNTGNIIINVEDSSNNISNDIEIVVKVEDTTPPVVSINNIEEGKKYLTISSVDYVIKDNFTSSIDTKIYLDGNEYKGNTINQLGVHTIRIVCTDESNNTTNFEVNFEIIKNNLIGCGTDLDCYSDNYMDVIYIALILFFSTVFIVIVRVAVKRSKTRNLKH